MPLEGKVQIKHNDNTWISLEQAFLAYDLYIGGKGGPSSEEKSMKQLSSEWLKSLEIAFKNAVLFYSQHLYESGYKHGNTVQKYYEINKEQRPFVHALKPKIKQFLYNDDSQNMGLTGFDLLEDMTTPLNYVQNQQDNRDSQSKSFDPIEKDISERIKQNKILNTDGEPIELNRYQFTFLYSIGRRFIKNSSKLKIRRCFFNELFRNVLVLKFNRIGMYTREFYSEDLQHIYCVLKVQDPVLIERAESYALPLQLELGFTDLFSLEPVDDCFRPIRYKEKTFREWEEQKLKSSKEKKGFEVKDIPLDKLEVENLGKNEKKEKEKLSEKKEELLDSQVFLPSATSINCVVQSILKI